MDTAATDPDGSGCYEIRLRGRLDPRWEASFEGMTLTSGAGLTRLTGPVTDQAALHGLLARLRDLGLPLVSVRLVVGAGEPCADHLDRPDPPRTPDPPERPTPRSPT